MTSESETPFNGVPLVVSVLQRITHEIRSPMAVISELVGYQQEGNQLDELECADLGSSIKRSLEILDICNGLMKCEACSENQSLSKKALEEVLCELKVQYSFLQIDSLDAEVRSASEVGKSELIYLLRMVISYFLSKAGNLSPGLFLSIDGDSAGGIHTINLECLMPKEFIEVFGTVDSLAELALLDRSIASVNLILAQAIIVQSKLSSDIVFSNARRMIVSLKI